MPLRIRIDYVYMTFILLSGIINPLHAQTKIILTTPAQTDPLIKTIHGPHIALYNTGTKSRHLLYLFLVGTGGKAIDSQKMDSLFAAIGFHAISIDYDNNVVAVSCARGLDSTSFDKYREEIITGKPVSEKVDVDSTNSILNRVQKLLIYLAKTDPTGKWGQFLKNNRPVWNKIVIAGHSQGSGHAAYIAKMYPVNKVLLFSGPQDFLEDLQMPAPWLSRKSATPPSKYYAFLNLKDPFNVRYQIANCMNLMQSSIPDTLMVQPTDRIDDHPRILINNISTKSPHNSTMLPVFENVWKYMATTE